jgi:glycosyltransferase involved in cell wall biosynthesis
MAKRFRLGLNFSFDNKSNSGVVNYIYNLIAALHALEDAEKPEIVLFYSANAPVDYLKSIGYRYIRYIPFAAYPSNVWLRKLNSLFLRVVGRDVFKEVRYFSKIDCLYPYFGFMDHAFAGFGNKVHWLVDFNNRAFPAHYEDQGESMRIFQEKVCASRERVILSSNALLDEMKAYHPGYACRVTVLRFASSLGRLEEAEVASVTQRYGLDGPYFMSPNQLWEHKNQGLVLDAIHLINQERPDLRFRVLFSGSLEVNRGKGLYIEKLRQKVREYNLGSQVSFLGVLDRKEQLLLMKGSIALVQPSLYEGWSTLVEEAKALNKFIVLSDLPVHREQIRVNVGFFNPHRAGELAAALIAQLENQAPVVPTRYDQNVKEFGRDIVRALCG